MERAQRRVLIQYPKRQTARGQIQQERSHLPLKVNTSGVIPPIFASSLLLMPLTIAQFAGRQAAGQTDSTWNEVLLTVTGLLQHGAPLYMFLYGAGIVFFCFFYTAVVFNPEETAENLKRYGGFIPGIRPGRPTAEYLQYVLSRITLPGSIYLGTVAVLPNLFLSITQSGQNQNFPFGGTAVLIMVGVGLETVKQIETQLNQRNYEGFLK
jgi:preprotein translocase subunit SecY